MQEHAELVDHGTHVIQVEVLLDPERLVARADEHVSYQARLGGLEREVRSSDVLLGLSRLGDVRSTGQFLDEVHDGFAGSFGDDLDEIAYRRGHREVARFGELGCHRVDQMEVDESSNGIDELLAVTVQILVQEPVPEARIAGDNVSSEDFLCAAPNLTNRIIRFPHGRPLPKNPCCHVVTLSSSRRKSTREAAGVVPFRAAERIESAEYVDSIEDARLVLDMLVGDLKRVIEYPALGFVVELEVPEDVRSAYELAGADHRR